MPSRTIDVNKIRSGTPNAQRVLASPMVSKINLSTSGEKPVDYSRVGAITGAAQMNPNWNPAAQQAWQTAHPVNTPVPTSSAPVQTTTNQPVQQPIQPQSNNISLPGTGTQSQFDTALQAVMKSRMETANAPYIQGGSAAISGLMTNTENLPSTEGWAGLTTSQAERVSQLEQSGLSNMYQGYAGALENKQSRQKDLLKTASDTYKDTLKVQTDAAKEIAKRRSDAIDSFQKLRTEIGKQGVPLNAESGQEFLNKLQTSDNPEQVLSDYTTAAFANPDVIAAYKPKKSGSGSTATVKAEEVKGPLENSDYEDMAQKLILGDISDSDLEFLLEQAGSDNVKRDIALIKKRAALLESALKNYLNF